MKTVLITGACGPAGINVTRSLNRHPRRYRTVGTDCSQLRQPLAETQHIYHVPHCNDSAYLDAMNVIIDRNHIDFVHPQPDVEVYAVSQHRADLHVATFLPRHTTIEVCQDKYLSTVAWKHHGLRVAATASVDSLYRVHEQLAHWGKPLWPLWVRDKSGAGGKGSTIAYNVETIRHWVGYWNSKNGVKPYEPSPFIVQEYLPGRNIAWHSVWREGELIVSMARERLEYIYPYLAPSGITGTPAVQRTIHDDTVNKVATDAVLAIDSEYSGVACVDLKEDGTGYPIPTEINAGRFFTTSYFFTAAGLNMPHIYLQVADGKHPKVLQYNALPKDLYWVRHIDAPAKLVKGTYELA